MLVAILELAVLIGACVVMYRVAQAEDLSGAFWVLITFSLCIGSLFLPLPFLRIIIAGAAAFGAMLVFKLLGD